MSGAVDESVTSVLARRAEVLEQLIEEARRELLAIKRMQRVAERHEAFARDLLKIDGAIASAELVASRGRETEPELGNGPGGAGQADPMGSWLDGDEET